MSLRTAILVFLSLSLLSTLDAFAQSRLSRTELTAVTNELNLSVEELQARSEQLQVQNADIALQMRELEAENAQLNGRIETLQFQLGQARDEAQRAQADDVEIGRQLSEMADRLDQLELQVVQAAGFASGSLPDAGSLGGAGAVISSARTPAAAGAATSGVNAPAPEGSLGTIAASDLPGEAGPLFADAKARLLRFDYEGAERSFQTFLTRFSDHEQAGEAQYWLAEMLHQQGAYAESGEAYRQVIREYPEDVRAPDALVKLGRSLRLVGDSSRACAVLDTLPTRYPDASPVTRQLADVERSRSTCSS